MRYLSLLLSLVFLVLSFGCGDGTKDRVTISEDIKPATVESLGVSLISATKMLEDVDRLIREKKIDEGLKALADAYNYIYHINNCYLQLMNARSYTFHAMLYAEVKRYSDTRDYLGKAVSNLQSAASLPGTSEFEKSQIEDIAKKLSAIGDVIETEKGKKLAELGDVYREMCTNIDNIAEGIEEKPEETSEEEGK